MSEHYEPPSPPFEPLFTLLTNATTNTTVHPRVHYIFTDDDPSILTSTPNALIVDLEPSPSNTTPSTSETPTQKANWAVSHASSLTPHFAITESHIHGAELRLEGVQRESVDDNSKGGDMEALADEFERRMCVLKKVVDIGEKRKKLEKMEDVAEEGQGADAKAAEEKEQQEMKTEGMVMGAI